MQTVTKWIRPTWEFFTHIKTSPLPVKGYKSWPVLGTYGHWAVTVYSVSHLRWHVASIHTGHTWTRDTHTYCGAFGSRAVTTCSYDLGLSRMGFQHPIFRLRGERSYRRGFTELNWLLIYCFQRADNVWTDHKQEIANLYEDGSED